MDSTDILPIIYDLDNLQENKDFSQSLIAQKDLLHSNQTQIALLNSQNTNLNSKISLLNTTLTHYSLQFPDIPPNLPRLLQFPHLPPQTSQIFHTQLLHFPPNFPQIYLPPENQSTPQAGPFYYPKTQTAYQGQFYRQQRHG